LHTRAFSHTHYAVALDEGADPVKLGLTKPEDKENAYVQCVDPLKPYTEGGTIIFRIRRISKMKVAVVLGTRPEIIKMALIVRALEREALDYFILHTGQHYSYNMDRIFFEQLELPEAK